MKTTDKKPAMTALAPWYGSKRLLARRVVEALGPHDAYYEPFCGSMAVLFAKPASREEMVNDLNRDLTNVAAVLQSRPLAADLLARLHFTLCAEEVFAQSRAVVAEPYRGPLGSAERAYHALVTWWLGRNGVAGTRKSSSHFCARYSAGGGSPGARWRGLVASVPWFVERLQRVQVLNRDAFDVLARIHDADGAVIYADPPYVEKSERYEHDLYADDHERLSVCLSRFKKARVVLSYYPHPSLDAMYPHDFWTHHAIVVPKKLGQRERGGTGAIQATELLITNRRPADASPDLFGAAP